MKSGVLFISYDGMLEPLGQSQVLAYIERLSLSRPIYLISFEKTKDWANRSERQELRARMVTAGIAWYPLRYHKKPAAIGTAWDIIRGTCVGLWLTIRYRLIIIHARSYVPSVMALFIRRLTGARFVFDMRGFWADERVDGGLWPRFGCMYRVAKWFEHRFLSRADHIVSLTHAAVGVMKRLKFLQCRMPPFTVIPTCADLRRFKPADNDLQGGPFVLGYVGSVGTWYMFHQVVETFAILRKLQPDARFLVVNRGEHEYIRLSFKKVGVPESSVEIISAAHSEVPALMARMSAGIFFIKPAFSKQASAPTKLAEFLGCGIPCLSNAGVGDMADVLEGEHVGVAIRSFDETSLHLGLVRFLSLCIDPEVSVRCVTAAHRHFSLDEGVRRYESIYTHLESIA